MFTLRLTFISHLSSSFLPCMLEFCQSPKGALTFVLYWNQSLICRKSGPALAQAMTTACHAVASFSIFSLPRTGSLSFDTQACTSRSGDGGLLSQYGLIA